MHNCNSGWLTMNSVAGLFTSKSRMGKALVYTYTLLPRLSRYVLDGRYNIDNNAIENVIHPIAVGRLCCAAHKRPYVGKLVMLAS